MCIDVLPAMLLDPWPCRAVPYMCQKLAWNAAVIRLLPRTGTFRAGRAMRGSLDSQGLCKHESASDLSTKLYPSVCSSEYPFEKKSVCSGSYC